MKLVCIKILAACAILSCIASVPAAQAQKNKKGNINLQQQEAATPLLAQGPVSFYVTIHGAKQGTFKGQSTSSAHSNQIQGLQFLSELTVPKTVGTGMPSGRRQYTPITITKQWDASSPQLYDAATSNELLTLVQFDFVRPGPGGQETVFETIKLTDATISSVKDYIRFTNPTDTTIGQPLEDISFTFSKIEITNNDGKTTAIDDWMQQ